VKITVASDLHLEFGDLEIANDDKADVLILSGDILVAKDIAQRDPYGVMGPEYRSNRYHDFMQRCSALFPHVIYVMGNHEHYNGDFAKTETHLKDVLGYLKNVYVLEKEIKVIDDVTFIGGTLWTDMNNGDSLTLYHMKAMMNDFRIIDNSHRKVSFKSFETVNGIEDRTKATFHERVSRFSPEDAFEEHAKFKGYIQQIIEGKFDQKFVVCGHHSPSKQSTHPRYADDTVMNGGYSSDMDEFITEHPQIKLWTHGHTHHVFDYMVGETRIVCNPRGYINYEPQASDFKLLTVEV
jgi:predicted phosphodiesterase